MLQVVRLAKPITVTAPWGTASEGDVVPVGSVGTIVDLYPGAAHVEFMQDSEELALEIVRLDDLQPLDAER